MNRAARLAGPADRAREGLVMLRFAIRPFNRVRCKLDTGNEGQV